MAAPFTCRPECEPFPTCLTAVGPRLSALRCRRDGPPLSERWSAAMGRGAGAAPARANGQETGSRLSFIRMGGSGQIMQIILCWHWEWISLLCFCPFAFLVIGGETWPALAFNRDPKSLITAFNSSCIDRNGVPSDSKQSK